MDYRRMPIEAESPEQFGYDRIRFNLAESSVADTPLRDLAVPLGRAWMAAQDSFEWVEPRGGVVGFPRFRPEVEVDVDAFYRILLDRYGTVVGPGHWFDQSRRHFRLGFGWPTPAELRGGLAALTAAGTGSRG